MYFITKRSSATGKKFQQLKERLDKALADQKRIAKELGFSEWRGGYWNIGGGFSAVKFKKTPDIKTWKNVNGTTDEWMPKLNTKKGKEIEKIMNNCTRVKGFELNKCIGWDSKVFDNTIGFTTTNKSYFGFIIGDTWNVKAPKDCTEVTFTKYQKMFK